MKVVNGHGPAGRLLIGGILAACVLAASAPMSAAMPTPDPSAPQAVWAALAAKLGIPVPTLLADVREVKLEEFQAFAARRHLSPAAIAAGERAIQSGQFAIVLLRPRSGHAFLPLVLAAAARSLGMTPDALRRELQVGNTLNALAERRGVPPASVERAIRITLEQAIAAAVEKGEMSRADAARLQGRLPTLVSRIMTWRITARAPNR